MGEFSCGKLVLLRLACYLKAVPSLLNIPGRTTTDNYKAHITACHLRKLLCCQLLRIQISLTYKHCVSAIHMVLESLIMMWHSAKIRILLKKTAYDHRIITKTSQVYKKCQSTERFSSEQLCITVLALME